MLTAVPTSLHLRGTPPQPLPGDRLRVGRPDEPSATILSLLARLREGERSAFDELVPILYDELREIAHRHRFSWRDNETVGTTALVHEVYLKLSGGAFPDWKDRAHVLAVASRAMRQILVDHVRKKQAQKRGGKAQTLNLDDVSESALLLPELSEEDSERLISLDRSLERLEGESARHCRVIECRFFGEMTIEETAEALGVSPATVKRTWAHARAWLHRDMTRTAADG